MTFSPDEIDLELVRRAQSGDRESLRSVVEAVYPSVRRWCLIKTGNPTEADDLTQDVMIRMIEKLKGYRGRSRFGTWLYSLTRNAAVDRLRQTRRRAVLLEGARAVEVMTPDASPAPDRVMERTTLTGEVRRLFTALPLRQREVLDLIDLQGYSAAETSQRLGIEPTSVRVHLHRARKALRRHILAAKPTLAEDLP